MHHIKPPRIPPPPELLTPPLAREDAVDIVLLARGIEVLPPEVSPDNA